MPLQASFGQMKHNCDGANAAKHWEMPLGGPQASYPGHNEEVDAVGLGSRLGEGERWQRGSG